MLNLTQKGYRDFKRLYTQAVNSGKEEFKYKGQTVLTSYAKYVIELLNI